MVGGVGAAGTFKIAASADESCELVSGSLGWKVLSGFPLNRCNRAANPMDTAEGEPIGTSENRCLFCSYNEITAINLVASWMAVRDKPFDCWGAEGS